MIQQGPSTSNVPVRTQEEADRERAKKANEMLQMEIKRDTEKLVQLSAELKESVDKSSQSLWAADTLKKAEQIEKFSAQREIENEAILLMNARAPAHSRTR